MHAMADSRVGGRKQLKAEDREDDAIPVAYTPGGNCPPGEDAGSLVPYEVTADNDKQDKADCHRWIGCHSDRQRERNGNE